MPFAEVSTNIFLVILGIGSLVFFHELGHFLAAKKIGVRVLIFSLGFGPPLVRRTWGETEYRLSAIPLGGYVKLAGEYPQEGVPRESWDFMSKSPMQRAIVLIAGVALNALLAFFVFILAFRLGVPFITSEIGEVTPGWPAWEAGLKPGDKIVEIDGTPDPDFEDVFTAVALGASTKGLSIKAERAGDILNFTVPPMYDPVPGIQRIGISPAFSQEIDKLFRYTEGAPALEAGLQVGDKIIAINGERVEQGERIREIELKNPGKELALTVLREGKELEFKATPLVTMRWMLGVSCATAKIQSVKRDSLAYQIGLRKGDEILAVGDSAVQGWTAVKDLFLESQEKVIHLQIKRGPETKVLELSLDSPGAKESFQEGIFPTMGLRVDHVVEGFPAESIGLRPGDQILSLNGESLRVWEALLRIMATSEGKEMTLQWQRGSETFSERFRPMKDEKNAFGRLGMKLKEKSIVKQYGFLGSCRAGTYKALVMIKRIYLTVRGLFTQKVSSETVGGIILIAQASYESAKLGLGKLLYFIGILSLQLAILNILPIPVLDGGHLLFLGIEKAKGSPVSERTMAIAQYIGLALILCLVVYSTRNDILRLLMRQ